MKEPAWATESARSSRISGAMDGTPSGPTLAKVWAAMIRARMPQRPTVGPGLLTRSGRRRGRRGRERVEGVEDGAPVGIHAHVLPVHDLPRPVAIEGNGQPGEVEGIAVHVGDHLVRRP